MALSLVASIKAKRRSLNYTVKPSIQGFIKWFWEYMSQFTGNADMQIVEFAALSSTEVVIANVACTLYALVLVKATATATYTKLTDHASTSSDADSEFRIKQAGAGQTMALMFPDGVPFASGITMQGNTTPSGGTGSAANGGSGFAILGAA